MCRPGREATIGVSKNLFYTSLWLGKMEVDFADMCDNIFCWCWRAFLPARMGVLAKNSGHLRFCLKPKAMHVPCSDQYCLPTMGSLLLLSAHNGCVCLAPPWCLWFKPSNEYKRSIRWVRHIYRLWSLLYFRLSWTLSPFYLAKLIKIVQSA